MLVGPLLGKAVTIIGNSPEDSCPDHAPLVRPLFGASKVFVYHATAGECRHMRSALLFRGFWWWLLDKQQHERLLTCFGCVLGPLFTLPVTAC